MTHTLCLAQAAPNWRACPSADDDVKEEEEETEGVHARNKRLKGRKAFAGLARQVLSLVPLAMVLTQPR